MPERVSVLRRAPRDRSKLEGLHGVIYVTLLSESYVHVGSSSIPFTVDEDLLIKLINSGIRDVKSLLQAVGLAQALQFNVRDGRPIIPGSSIKGNVRSRLELSFRPKGGYVRSCFIRARAPFTTKPPRGMHGWRHFSIWGEVLFEERGPPCDLTRMDCVCLICDLFGTTGLKSLVDFSDFVGEGVAENMLEQMDLEYETSLVAAKLNSKFDGRVLFQGFSPSELGLLLIGMRVGGSVLLGKLKYKHKVSGKMFGKARYEVKAMEFLEESQNLEVGGVLVKRGERFEGADLAKLVEGLKSCAREEFKGEIVEVDEVAIVEQLS